MNNKTNQKQNDFSLYSDIAPAAFKYLIAIIMLFPGYLLGEYILIPWYLITLALLFFKRTDLIIQVVIIWVFLFAGAYQYNWVGNSLENPLFKNLNIYLFICLFISYLLSKKIKVEDFSKISKFGYILLIVILLSGLVNLVNPVDIGQAIIATLKWFIFAVIVATSDIKDKKFKPVVSLIIAILIINSVFSFFQQVILPPQTTPDGYIPKVEDLASGFIGATAGPQLTSLCLVVASFFIYRYLTGCGKNNLVFVCLLLIQPFISESKAALISGGFFFIITFIVMVCYSKIIKLKPKVILRYITVLLVIWGGVTVYKISKSNYGYNYAKAGMIDKYFNSTQAFTDLSKIKGYYDAITIIAPSGKLGILLGIGPNQFYKRKDFVSSLGFDFNEGNKVSSIDFKITEMNVFFCDMGVIGLLVFLIGIGSVYFYFIKKSKYSDELRLKILALVISQFLLMTLFNSFYWTGFFYQLYFCPIWVFIVYYLKNNQKLKINADRIAD